MKKRLMGVVLSLGVISVVALGFASCGKDSDVVVLREARQAVSSDTPTKDTAKDGPTKDGKGGGGTHIVVFP